MKIKWHILILVFCFMRIGTSCIYAQKEAAVWLFKRGTVIDFNSNAPVLSNIGDLFAPYTGIASISNKKGELLFYTNGASIYDGQHNLVPNGTGFTWSVGSDANMLIIPVGVQEKKYYLVTADARNLIYDVNGSGGTGVDCCYKNDTTTCYSIINVSTDKKVSIEQKNIPLLKPGDQFVAATRHVNGVDTWVVTMQLNTKKFYAFLFAECGVSAPVISEIEVEIWPFSSQNLICSPDGRKLLATLAGNFLMDFDNNTGIVSNPVNITNYVRASIMTFSPKSNYIYSHYDPLSSYDEVLMQYDIQNQSLDSIIIKDASVIDSGLGSGMRPAIDGKIYSNGGGWRDILYAIEKPDESPLKKENLKYNLGVLRTPRVSGDFPIFPNFISSYFDPDYASQQIDIGVPEIQPPPRICMGDTVYFNVNKTQAVSEYFWSFGDGEIAYNIKEPKHCYNDGGVFTARLIVRYNCIYDTIYTIVTVDNKREPFREDTVFGCNTSTLDAGTNYNDYLWSTGETTSKIEVNAEGIYKVKLDNACGIYEDTYIVISPETKGYNLITPNNDGQNEYLYFDQTPLPGRLVIFNRWGNKIYESNDYQNNWNAKGQSDGLYYYRFNYEGCPVYNSWLNIVR